MEPLTYPPHTPAHTVEREIGDFRGWFEDEPAQAVDMARCLDGKPLDKELIQEVAGGTGAGVTLTGYDSPESSSPSVLAW